MREETKQWLEMEMVKKEKRTWDSFANSAFLLAQFYPEIKENKIWLTLIERELIVEEKGN